jgi:hypothetical protein
MAKDYSCMYSGWETGGGGDYTDEWMDKTIDFLDRAFSQTQIVWCPSSICQNSRCLEDKRTIAIQLCKNHFVPGFMVSQELDS